MGERRFAHDLDGKLLWELGGMSSLVIPTPLAKFGMLYLSSGYVNDKAQPIFVVKPGASGDISLKEKQTTNDFIAWSVPKGGPYNPSPILYGKDLYVLYDFGFMSCYDARTGKEIYKRQRIGGGGNAFTSSPWAANGKIYCLSEDGDTFVVQAGPEFKVLGKNSLDEMCMAPRPRPPDHPDAGQGYKIGSSAGTPDRCRSERLPNKRAFLPGKKALFWNQTITLSFILIPSCQALGPASSLISSSMSLRFRIACAIRPRWRRLGAGQLRA